MNLRDLRYVCAVADHKHFGRAAAVSHVSQPTLSGQIRKLENYLGVEIFERTNKSVRLTPAGERIVALARDVLRGADEIERVADAEKDPAAGPLRIGLIPTIAPYLIPLFLAPLRRRLPSIRPVFVETVTQDLEARLEAGDLDAVILATAPASPRLRSLPLYREPFWLAVPRGHPLEHARTIDLGALTADELLLLTEGHCFRDQALAACRLKAPAEGADMSATSLETIINLVGAGQGVTLAPALATKGAWTTDLGVIVRQLDEGAAYRDVRLVYRSGFPRRAVLEQVADVIRSVVPSSVTALESV
ncbi:MAG: LysR substrate-binding domain-containing protein [Kiloniellales bacterium]|nr:LysR substrate-binding domain-containing protein [Kiloniellales bacterium]